MIKERLDASLSSDHPRPEQGREETQAPLVSVVTTVYNGELYLADGIRSILGQTLDDFEFIIVDDGSTDNTPEILARYQANDSRIRLHRSEQNQGIYVAANIGCRLARGKYIARMDADDMSLPERLAKQVAYMERHPDIGVLGSWVRYKDRAGRHVPTSARRPANPGWTMWTLNFYCHLRHSGVMMRRRVVEQLGFYDAQSPLAQDYDLWLRASLVTRVAELPEILVEVRKWQGSVSHKHAMEQKQILLQVGKNHFARLLGIDVPNDAIKCLDALGRGRSYVGSLAQLRAGRDLLAQLWPAFVANHSLTKAEVRAIRLDAGVKLWLLAGLIGRHDFRGGLGTALQAMKAHPASIIVGGFKLARRIFLRILKATRDKRTQE